MDRGRPSPLSLGGGDAAGGKVALQQAKEKERDRSRLGDVAAVIEQSRGSQEERGTRSRKCQ